MRPITTSHKFSVPLKVPVHSVHQEKPITEMVYLKLMFCKAKVKSQKPDEKSEVPFRSYSFKDIVFELIRNKKRIMG